jgi:hypothetical protein
MSQPDVIDTRNLDWRSNNVGAKLLEKMGWKEGQGVGKRQRNETVSSEGLRIRKRAIGLGIGAVHAQHDSTAAPVDSFASLLASLKAEHSSAVDDDVPQKKKKRKKTITLSGKATHQKTRDAKFKAKSADDMKGIFAGGAFVYEEEVPSKKKKKQKKEKK